VGTDCSRKCRTYSRHGRATRKGTHSARHERIGRSAARAYWPLRGTSVLAAPRHERARLTRVSEQMGDEVHCQALLT